MPYIIYNKETTKILLALARSVGCYVENYKSASAAKAALTRLDNKGKLGDQFDTERPYVKADFAVAELFEFRNTIEKTVTSRNAMTGAEFEESINANFATSPSSENYWCS